MIFWEDENRSGWGKLVFSAQERHIPIKESVLAQWQTEASTLNNSYGDWLRYAIKWAKSCNGRGCEALIMA